MPDRTGEQPNNVTVTQRALDPFGPAIGRKAASASTINDNPTAEIQVRWKATRQANDSGKPGEDSLRKYLAGSKRTGSSNSCAARPAPITTRIAVIVVAGFASMV